MARANQIPPRIHVLWIAGAFWHGRFQRWMHPFIPHRILLMLPEFQVELEWLPFAEIYGNLHDLTNHADHGFTNTDETLFETIQQHPLDFSGELKHCDCDCDLSAFVIEDSGTYSSRDQVLYPSKSFQYTWRGFVFEWLYGNKSSRAYLPELYHLSTQK